MSLQQTDGIGWLSANGVRNYPLDDLATRTDLSGRQLPDAVLADLHLWFPDTLGDGAFVSAVVVGPGMVSVTLEASGGAALAPLAHLSLVKPVDPFRNYALTSAADGAGGWVAFGPGVNDVPAGSWRFDSTGSPVLQRLARAYPVTGVTEIRKNSVPGAMTGVIRLRSGNAGLVTVEKTRLDVGGEERDCVVVRLNESSAGPEVYEQFAGPCGGAIESGSCQRKSPITSINGVTPCCTDGLLIIDVVEDGVDVEDSDLYFSWSDTRTAPEEGETNPTGTVLGWDYAVGLEDVCVKGTAGFALDQVDNCDVDGQCTPWDDVSSLPTQCASVSGSGYLEVGWPGSDSVAVHYSSLIEIDPADVGGVRIEGLNEGWLFLIDNAATVTEAAGTWTLPANCIGFENNKGFLLHNAARVYGAVGNVDYPVSSEKTFEHTGSVGSVVYPEGDAANHGTGTVANLADISVTLRMFNTIITSAELAAISATGQFRLAHVAGGRGSYDVQFWCFPSGARVDHGDGETEGAGVGGGSPL